MNYPDTLLAALSSPSDLLGELGIGKEVFLLRLRGPEERSGFVPLESLDENIKNYGSATLAVRIGAQLYILRLRDPFKKEFFCAALRFNYQKGIFLFGMCRGGFQDSFWIEVPEAWQKGYKLIFVPIAQHLDLCP